MNQIIGLDIGGTKIEGIIYNDGKIARRLFIPTPKDLAAFKRGIAGILTILSDGQNIAAVGIGMAGVADDKKGVMITSPNLKFIKNFNIRKFVCSLGFKEVRLDNDASCFTRAEMALGKGRGCKDVIGVILGTEMGAGIYIDGENFRGRHGSGGEVGQLMVGNDTLEHHYQEAKDRGDYNEVAHLLAIRLADLVNILDPDCIVLGGSVSLMHHKKFLPQALRLMRGYILNKNLKLKVWVSSLESAGALGAALLFAKK